MSYNRRSLTKHISQREVRDVPHIRVDTEEEVLDVYDLHEVLGQGSYGTVYRVVHKGTEENWAMKTIDKSKAGSHGVRMLELEIGVLKRVSHPFVVFLKEVFETPQKSYLLFEYCKGRDLSIYTPREGKRSRLSDPQLSTIFKRLADAVSYLHQNDIVHRDLKLENVMIKGEDPTDIRVSDFGLSAVKSKESQLQLVCGTPAYMAPEVLADLGCYSPLCDEWSLGIMLYVLLTGVLPFLKIMDSKTLSDALAKGSCFQSAAWQSSPPLAKELVQQMLVVDPSRRITAREVLESPWITGMPSSSKGTWNVLDMMKDLLQEEVGSPLTERSGSATPCSRDDSPSFHGSDEESFFKRAHTDASPSSEHLPQMASPKSRTPSRNSPSPSKANKVVALPPISAKGPQRHNSAPSDFKRRSLNTKEKDLSPSHMSPTTTTIHNGSSSSNNNTNNPIIIRLQSTSATKLPSP